MWRTAAVWVGLHALLLLAIGAFGVQDCAPVGAGGFTCGAVVALIALSIAGVQLLYGLVGGLLLLLFRVAVGQGVLIGTALVTFVFTALCFAAAAAA